MWMDPSYVGITQECVLSVSVGPAYQQIARKSTHRLNPVNARII